MGGKALKKLREIEAVLSAMAGERSVPFKKGQMIRIPRLDMKAMVTAIDNANKIELEAQLFGRATKITLPASEIEAI